MAQQTNMTSLEWYYEQTVVLGKTNYAELLEQAKQMDKEQIIRFHKWMKENDTPGNAFKYFGYSDEDMLNEYLNNDGAANTK